MSGDISRFNGKKGGRPKGSKASHTLKAEKAREYIVARVVEELKPIIDKAIEQAKMGDQASRRELLDRAFGKPKLSVENQEEVSLLIDF